MTVKWVTEGTKMPPERLAELMVKDSKTGKTWLKVVNALPRTLKLQVNGLGSKAVEVKARSSQVFEL